MLDLTFGDFSLSSVPGVVCVGADFGSCPRREVLRVPVPGRNGDLVLDGGRFANLDVHYSVIIPRRLPDALSAIKAGLASSGPGYRPLRDSQHPHVHRMASFSDGFQVRRSDYDTLEITFNCKPQLFLDAGETPVIVDLTTSADQIVSNPGLLSSRPLITIEGQTSEPVTLEVLAEERQDVRIKRIDGSITIDAELQTAYRDAVNLNPDISTANIQLAPGDSLITVTGSGLTKLTITPRWVTL